MKSILVAALFMAGCVQADVGHFVTLGGNTAYFRNANANQVRHSSDHAEAMALKQEYDAKMDAVIEEEQHRDKERNKVRMSSERQQCEVDWKMDELVLVDQLSKATIKNYEARYNALINHRLMAHSKVQKCMSKTN